MSNRKGFTKLIDIHDQAERLHVALEKYLKAHTIEFRRTHFKGDGFIRFSVQWSNLCCARAVLPALYDLAKRAPK